jgi:hypothetical protein
MNKHWGRSQEPLTLTSGFLCHQSKHDSLGGGGGLVSGLRWRGAPLELGESPRVESHWLNNTRGRGALFVVLSLAKVESDHSGEAPMPPPKNWVNYKLKINIEDHKTVVCRGSRHVVEY